MTLAFKWYYRYKGEGSAEYDQFIELFKCSFDIYFFVVMLEGFLVFCQRQEKVYSTEILG